MQLQLTSEQEAIINAATTTNANLSIVARAGAAKTTTLRLVAEALPSETRILCLAFNKGIAMEMKAKLPANCECLTLNALGHRALGRFLGSWPKIDVNKGFEIVKELSAPRKSFRNILEGLHQSKLLGYTPYVQADSLLSFPQLIEALPLELEDDEKEFLKRATVKSNKQVFEKPGLIDFDDQILCGTTFPVTYPQYDVVLVDEAQDLSPLNHMMLKKIVRKNRLIVVGDPLQAIYAFRGAHEHSMAQLAETFKTVEYKLTTSFRCAKSIVKEANSLAPDMKPADEALEGVVDVLSRWDTSVFADGDAILSRLNAPLFFLNSIMFAQGKNCEFVGHDIVKRMIKMFKSLGDKHLDQAEVLSAIDVWEEKNLLKYKGSPRIRDEANSMRVVAGLAKDNAGMQSYLRRLLKIEGRIKLMTVHKSKGLEFNNVFILEPDDIGEEGQENNIRYVAQTRAKQRLTYISFEGYRS